MNMYPTDDELEKIESWNVFESLDNYHAFMNYVRELWTYPDWGWKKDEDTYNISTGGWSGNEEIIQSMKKSRIFWILYWQQTQRGGHYTFSPVINRSIK